MTTLRNAIVPVALAVGAAIVLLSCTRTPSHATSDVASPAASSDACEALRKRVSACLANIKNGSLDLEFDPATMTDPVQCQQTNDKFTLLAKVVRCEDAAPATP